MGLSVSFFDFGVNSDNLGAHRLAGSKFFCVGPPSLFKNAILWMVYMKQWNKRVGHRGSVCWLEALHPSLGAGAYDFRILRYSVVAAVFV